MFSFIKEKCQTADNSSITKDDNDNGMAKNKFHAVLGNQLGKTFIQNKNSGSKIQFSTRNK